MVKRAYPPISPGTLVQTTDPNMKMRKEWTDEGWEKRKWGVRGKVLRHHDSHGLCYDVKHEDGSEGCYDPSEFRVCENESPAITREFRYSVRGDQEGIVVAANFTENDKFGLAEINKLYQELLSAIPFEYETNREPQIVIINDSSKQRFGVISIEMSIYIDPSLVSVAMSKLNENGFIFGLLVPMTIAPLLRRSKFAI